MLENSRRDFHTRKKCDCVSLIFASFTCFLFLFPVVFVTFEVVFGNCKCRSWCRPDDLVSSYIKDGTVLMYFSLI